ncbi:hypothetical protein F5883DRAFT_6627 [Diaporthe sp. PMI_573]|nr:hypothetical protein F5883DRAFT_6627 [Diaporthaceae sp. PMI_573]
MMFAIGRRGRTVFCALIYLSVCISWRIRATRARVVRESEYIRKSYYHPSSVRCGCDPCLAALPIHRSAEYIRLIYNLPAPRRRLFSHFVVWLSGVDFNSP